MLSRDDNELLTRVGPGTPMGELLRRFWMPALLEEEVAEPDGPPVRLRLLGEDLVAFRDTNGKIGILDTFCPHRRASLYFGRNEEGGIRCVYHGWKFDVDGTCLERASEPPEMNVGIHITTTAYPTAIRGGVVWTYMGPKEFAAEPPEFEWSVLPPDQRTAVKRLEQCNWAQAVEGGIDSSHISFLHRNLADFAPSGNRSLHSRYAAGKGATFEVDETDYGLRIAARREAEADSYYWRVTQFLLPFYTMIPPILQNTPDSHLSPFGGHAWVPIDDENTWTWSFGAHPNGRYEGERGHGGTWGPIDEHYRPLLNRDNEYKIDREKQKTRSFTGIEGIPNQDAAVQESMGAIVDRTQEHLGHSDRGIAAFRRLLINLAKDLRAGSPPEAARHGDWYNVRSGSVILDRKTPMEEGAAWLLTGDKREAAE